MGQKLSEIEINKLRQTMGTLPESQPKRSDEIFRAGGTKNLPYSQSEGSESSDSHELASGDTMLVGPTLTRKLKTHLEMKFQSQALRLSEEEYSLQVIEEGKRSVTNANVSGRCALVNFDEEHRYVYGIDDGLEAGVAIVDMIRSMVVFKGIIHLRDDVKRLMMYRREHRRARRNRLRYREVRFDNRRRSVGWIPPSVKVKRDNIIRVVGKLAKKFPPSKIVYEENSFDVKKLMFPDIEGREYQLNLWYALLSRAGNKCEVCRQEGKLEKHHVVPISEGGTNQVTNILIVHEKCHKKIHEGKVKVIAAKNIVVPYVNYGKTYFKAELSKIAPLEVVYGYQTRIWRERMGLEKNHWNDAIAMVSRGEKLVDTETICYCLAKRRRLYYRSKGLRCVMGFMRGDIVRYNCIDGSGIIGCITSLYKSGFCKIGAWDGKGSFERTGPCSLSRCDFLSRDSIIILAPNKKYVNEFKELIV